MSPVEFNRIVIAEAKRKGFSAFESDPFPFDKISTRKAAFIRKTVLFVDTGKPTISAYAYVGYIRGQIEIWVTASDDRFRTHGWIKRVEKVDQNSLDKAIASQVVSEVSSEITKLLMKNGGLTKDEAR